MIELAIWLCGIAIINRVSFSVFLTNSSLVLRLGSIALGDLILEMLVYHIGLLLFNGVLVYLQGQK